MISLAAITSGDVPELTHSAFCSAGASKVAGVQIAVRAVAGLGMRPQEASMPLPLLLACQGGHPAVVITVIDFPVLPVESLLPLAGLLQILLSLFLADAVNGNEMPHQLFVPLNVAAKQDVLDVVAVPAQCREAAQPLDAGFFVVLPDFVAVQHAFAAA